MNGCGVRVATFVSSKLVMSLFLKKLNLQLLPNNVERHTDPDNLHLCCLHVL